MKPEGIYLINTSNILQKKEYVTFSKSVKNHCTEKYVLNKEMRNNYHKKVYKTRYPPEPTANTNFLRLIKFTSEIDR